MFEVTTRRQAFITQQNVKSVAYYADDGLYMLDIMRGGIGNEDTRIPRNVSEQSAGEAW